MRRDKKIAPMPPQVSIEDLDNPEYQGITFAHEGKTYLIINGKLEELSEEDVTYFERMTYETRNSMIRNNLLA